MDSHNTDYYPVDNFLVIKIRDLAEKLNIDLSKYHRNGTLFLDELIGDINYISPSLSVEISNAFL